MNVQFLPFLGFNDCNIVLIVRTFLARKFERLLYDGQRFVTACDITNDRHIICDVTLNDIALDEDSWNLYINFHDFYCMDRRSYKMLAE